MPERWTEYQLRRLSYIFSDPIKAKEIILAKLCSPREVGFVTNDGHLVVGMLPDFIASWKYRGYPHEPEVTTYMKHVLRPGNSVIYAGAHIGIHAVDASYLVKEKGRVICFEPTPSTYTVLRKNCEDRRNMTAINMAIGKQLGTAELTELGVGLSSCNTLAGTPRVSDEILARCRPHKTDVQVVTIDDCLAHDESGKCDLLVLDVENSEMDALLGAAKTLARCKPAIIIEIGDLGRTQRNCTRACLFFLAYMGYEIFEYNFETNQIVPHTIQEAYPDSGNLLCIHKERLAH
jgi:FkbM family methyltransferase